MIDELDHHRPRFHIRPPRGYLNDPNGPVVVNGTTHMYFQYRLGVDTADPVVWGHATSENLVDWTLHRAAMTPDPEGLDRDGCWSGNTVVAPDGRVVAFYSGFRREHPVQSALRAVSDDGGRSFGAPTLAVADPGGAVRVRRDPFVWREGDGWRMVLGEGDADERASARSYRSRDLVTWIDEGPLAVLRRTVLDDVDTGAMWECPQVADVDGTQVLLVGAWSEHDGIMRVLAILPGHEADRVEGLGAYPIDEGPNFYAPSVLRRDPDGPLLWGWVTEGRDEAWWREAGWAGVLSLPRELRLDDRGRVLSRPAAHLDALRDRATSQRLAGGASATVGAQAELLIESVGLDHCRVRLGTADEFVEFGIDPRAGRLTIDLRSASRDPRAHGGLVVMDEVTVDGLVELRVFLDGSVLEVFASTGRAATCRIYPLASPPWSLRSEGAVSITYWDLSESCGEPALDSPGEEAGGLLPVLPAS